MGWVLCVRVCASKGGCCGEREWKAEEKGRLQQPDQTGRGRAGRSWLRPLSRQAPPTAYRLPPAGSARTRLEGRGPAWQRRIGSLAHRAARPPSSEARPPACSPARRRRQPASQPATPVVCTVYTYMYPSTPPQHPAHPHPHPSLYPSPSACSRPALPAVPGDAIPAALPLLLHSRHGRVPSIPMHVQSTHCERGHWAAHAHHHHDECHLTHVCPGLSFQHAAVVIVEPP